VSGQYAISVETTFQDLEYDDAPVVRIVESTLKAEGCADAAIDVILVDDEYLRELKREYFAINAFTDVIAFRLNPYEESVVDGEIYISLHRAVGQAKQYDTTADMEILRLAAHGTLHLLGYEDETPEQKHRMTAMEDEQLRAFQEPMIITGLPSDE